METQSWSPGFRDKLEREGWTEAQRAVEMGWGAPQPCQLSPGHSIPGEKAAREAGGPCDPGVRG